MIIDVRQKSYDKSCEQEQQFPSNIHWYHLPSREGKKKYAFPNREATAPLWCPPGISAANSISYSTSLVKINIF